MQQMEINYKQKFKCQQIKFKEWAQAKQENLIFKMSCMITIGKKFKNNHIAKQIQFRVKK